MRGLLIIMLFVLVFSKKGFGQEKLPIITRASPEAESLGQYGSLPVNLSTGKISHTIPIYTISIGDFQYPLYIAYNYDGLKANSVPSMLGMGWVANFGGAVIREVKGLADDEPFTGYFSKGSKYENYNSLPTSEKVLAMGNAADGVWDISPDKYMVNTQTINADFRFNTNQEPIFNDYKNYKVTINSIPFSSGFDIQQDNGALYQFRDAEIQHITYLDANKDIEYFNSWMLSKIVLPASTSTIDFNYSDYTFSNSVNWFSHSIKDYGSYQTEGDWEGWKQYQNFYETDSKIIESIVFPNGNIQFLYDTNLVLNCFELSGISTGCNYKKLSEIIITNTKGRVVEKYLFDYEDHGAYYFLKTIKKEDKNGVQIDYYEFDYDVLEYNGSSKVPVSRIDNSQVDFWGYYNGSTFNYTAGKDDMFNSLEPDFLKGRVGALTKITYPTGGSTEIEYEPHSVPRGGYYGNNNPIYDVSEKVFLTSSDVYYNCEQGEKVIEVPYSQSVTVEFEMDITDLDSYVHCGIKDSNNNIVAESALSYVGEEETHVIETETAFLMSGREYTLFVEVCDNRGVGQNPIARTEVFYRTNYYFNDPNPQVANIDIGGIRVAKTKDCPDGSGLNCIEKEYRYVKQDKVNSSGQMADPFPRFKTVKTSYRYITANNGFKDPSDGEVHFIGYIMDEKYDFYSEHYMPISGLLTNGGHVNYSRIEIVSENEEVGKEVKHYSIFNHSPFYHNSLNYGFPKLYEDFGFKNNKLVKNEVFEFLKENPKQQVMNYYSDANGRIGQTFDPSKYASEYAVLRHDNLIVKVPSGRMFVDDQLFRFTIDSLRHVQKSYMPFSYTEILDVENNESVTKNKAYSYHPELGYLTSESTSNSDGTITKNEYKYPSDLVGSEQFLLLQELIDENRVSSPIMSTVTLIDNQNNETKLFEEHSKYGRSVNTGNLLLPIEKHTKKGVGDIDILTTDNLRVIYSKYNDQGNVLEVQLKDGMQVSYIWGYNEQYPIAKIENATISEVTSTIGNLPAVYDTLAEIQSLSDADDDRTLDTINPNGTIGKVGKEGDLREALRALRQELPDAVVTTYTYDPLIGVTSITDPKGYTMYYEYDEFNRLKHVKDADGNILGANEYNYKQ